MTSLSLSDKDVTSLKVDALVLGVARGDDGPVLVEGPSLPKGLRSALTGALDALGVTGKEDEVTKVPSGGEAKAAVVVLTGLGKAPDRGVGYPTETLRRAAGAATRSLAGTASVALALPTADVAAVAAVAEGALLGAYAFTRHRVRTDADVKRPVSEVTVVTGHAKDKAAGAALTRAEHLAAAVHLTRDLPLAP